MWPGVEPEPPIQVRSANPPVQRPAQVPDVPAHLRRATIEPSLATVEVFPLPPERLAGPAELEFDDVDADWFREGTMETAPEREETPPPPPIPLWAFAIPLVSSVAVFGMGLAVAYLALLA
ncbi:MAG: hypothetical protein JRJ84_13945 [Deltaproteobacteria bacterium]|nr:hypothetical protein [Deltaproteobacteria bacterium]